jgi:hypothetical protein
LGFSLFYLHISFILSTFAAKLAHDNDKLRKMKDNKQAALELGQKPVGQLLWQYALPAIVAMTA